MNECPSPSAPRRRIVLAAVLGIVIVLGLASRKFGHQLPAFLAAHAGDALWTVAVYLALAIVFPRWQPLRLGLAALAVSFAVETSQLLRVEWLDQLRRTLPGRLLLGSGFLWIDLVRYAAGAAIATAADGIVATTRRAHDRSRRRANG